MGPLSLEGDKPSDTVTEPGQRELVRSTGEASGGLRPKPELDSVGGSLTLEEAFTLGPIAMPENTKVDWKFMEKVESRVKSGEVPIDTRTGRHFTTSGVTIATGFDLGQWNGDDLKKLGLSEKNDLYQRLLPYLGEKGEKAAKLVAEKPLTITEEEAEWLDSSLKAHFVEVLNRKYRNSPENTQKALFTDLPPAAQTAVFSVAYHKGGNGMNEVKGFKTAAMKQDWQEAVNTLVKDAYTQDNKGLRNRRLKEALHLYDELSGEVLP